MSDFAKRKTFFEGSTPTAEQVALAADAFTQFHPEAAALLATRARSGATATMTPAATALTASAFPPGTIFDSGKPRVTTPAPTPAAAAPDAIQKKPETIEQFRERQKAKAAADLTAKVQAGIAERKAADAAFLTRGTGKPYVDGNGIARYSDGTPVSAVNGIDKAAASMSLGARR